jgi:hypothetical protein
MSMHNEITVKFKTKLSGTDVALSYNKISDTYIVIVGKGDIHLSGTVGMFRIKLEPENNSKNDYIFTVGKHVFGIDKIYVEPLKNFLSECKLKLQESDCA